MFKPHQSTFGQSLIVGIALCSLTARNPAALAEDSIDFESTYKALSAKQKEVRAMDQPTAYQEHIANIDKAVKRFPKEALLLALRGQAHFQHSGIYARQGDFAKSAEISRFAYADFDAAVTMAPDHLKVRAARGSSYAYLPAMLGKSEVAMEDLKFVTEHKDFETQFPADARAALWLQLGTLYATAGIPELAGDAFRKALKLQPSGKVGEKAKEELEKLNQPISATDPQGNRRPDRFPGLPLDAGPLMVAATVTIPEAEGHFSDAHLPNSMKTFLTAVKNQPGYRGMHRLESQDTKGMFVILTWWKDKTALNNFFYSDAHQGIIRKYYQAGESTAQVHSSKPLGQVGIEVFSALPAGRTVNGGLTPMFSSQP